MLIIELGDAAKIEKRAECLTDEVNLTYPDYQNDANVTALTRSYVWANRGSCFCFVLENL